MNPKALVIQWVEIFNKADAKSLASLYSENAINHQVNTSPIEGKAAIQKMFGEEFAKANMVCIIENIFEDGEWAILEWKNPLGLRGCGLFHIVDDKIIFQRGYWDRLTFLRQHGLEVPKE
ncbi:nuclear transport factor 2 family protein [Ginsengibacter hankyongi]|uniref:Nuclear transport factor 2 family protein n=1 Tax=Ginsengibacter hankyongi TaxID=2607284 RepID=A0A5J5IGF0_9BACT|nr:nuclear transport factor 2 family protein [Ginsengibacter hankyongi]KAA9036304.1 nuclear transport factor 2 family protein [Ginsengibacter hankyongi]